MAVTLNANTSTGFIATSDTSGVLQLQTGGTTAVTVDASQRTAFVAGTAALPAITTSGDTNTGIFFPAADTIAFAEGGAEVARFDSSGSLIVNGTSPSSISTIYPASGSANTLTYRTSGNTGAGALHAYSDVNGPAGGIGHNISINSGGSSSRFNTTYAAWGIWMDCRAGSEAMRFDYLNTSGTYSERMRIDSSGNLGIGTTSPVGYANYKGLTVADTTGGFVHLRNTANTQQFELGINGGTSTAYLATYTSTPIQFLINSTEAGRFDSSGNLLVGATSTASSSRFYSRNASNTAGAFAMSGSSVQSTAAIVISKPDATNTTSQIFVQLYNGDFATGNGQINGNGANAAAFGTFSDSRLKQNIVNLPSQLDNIMALRPVEYDYIESEGGGHQIGFVAQEVQSIYPDLVGERADGMLTLSDFNKNDARLIKAIQEMKSIIDTQASTITQLTARITALEGA